MTTRLPYQEDFHFLLEEGQVARRFLFDVDAEAWRAALRSRARGVCKIRTGRAEADDELVWAVRIDTREPTKQEMREDAKALEEALGGYWLREFRGG